MKFRLFVISLLLFLVSGCTFVGYNWPFMGGGTTYSATNSSHDNVQVLLPSNVVIAANNERYASVGLAPSETVSGRLSYNLTGYQQVLMIDYKRWSKNGRYLGHLAYPIYVSPQNDGGASITLTDEGLVEHRYGCSSLVCRWQ